LGREGGIEEGEEKNRGNAKGRSREKRELKGKNVCERGENKDKPGCVRKEYGLCGRGNYF
jgi:hypothetical protein